MKYIKPLVFISVFTILQLRIFPTIPPEDSGELISAASTLSIAHPSGYPLFTLTGRLFSFTGLGNKSYRVNTMSSFLGAATVYIIYLILLRLTGRPLPGLIAAALLLFSVNFTEVSLLTEVYSLNIFLVVLFNYLILSGASLYLLAFIAGLGMTNHLTFVFTVFSAAVYFLISYLPTRWKLKSSPLKGLTTCGQASAQNSPFSKKGCHPPNRWMTGYLCFIFLCGMSVYFYMPLRSMNHPTVDWGAPGKSLDHFITAVTRKDTGITKMSKSRTEERSLQSFFVQTKGYLKYLRNNFGAMPVVFIIILILSWIFGLTHKAPYLRIPAQSPGQVKESVMSFLRKQESISTFHHRFPLNSGNDSSKRDEKNPPESPFFKGGEKGPGGDGIQIGFILLQFLLYGFFLSFLSNMPFDEWSRHNLGRIITPSLPLFLILAFMVLQNVGEALVASRLRAGTSPAPTLKLPHLLSPVCLFCIFAMLALALFVFSGGRILDFRNDFLTYDYAKNIFNSTGRGSLLTMIADTPIFSAINLRETENYRRDISLLYLTGYQWRKEQIQRSEPGLLSGEERDFPQISGSIDPLKYEIFCRNYGNRKIFTEGVHQELSSYLAPHGLVNELVIEPPDKDLPARKRAVYSGTGLLSEYLIRNRIEKKSYWLYYDRQILEYYSAAYANMGIMLESFGDSLPAKKFYSLSVKYDQANPAAK